MSKYENTEKLLINQKTSNFNRWDSKLITKSRSVTTILLSEKTFLFLILTQRLKVKHQNKHKNKHKNNVQLIDCLTDDCQFSLKHLSVFTQSANLRLWSRAKRVIDLTESISEVSEQNQSQNQNQHQINLYNELICQRQHFWMCFQSCQLIIILLFFHWIIQSKEKFLQKFLIDFISSFFYKTV